MTEYDLGYTVGYADGLVICSPIKTNGHTLEVFNRVRGEYTDAIYSMTPTEYQLGYGLGFDQAAEEAGVPVDVHDA